MCLTVKPCELRGLHDDHHGVHEADCEKPDKHSQQVRETNRDSFIKEHVIGKLLYIQPLIRA